ncbi:MAG: CoA-binding protein [Acidimicrobiia bacterium]
MHPDHLARLLSPASVAVVGASEKLGMSNNAVLPMLEAGIDVALVNPNRDQVYDRPTVPSLSALARPVDAVLSLVSAERSIGVVEEAAALGCGGVAVAAGGFAEMGDEGRALQARLAEAAGAMAVVGPNCSGFMNVRERINLFTGGRIALHPGPVSVVSQSGFLLRSALAAGQQRQLGFGIAVSSGNEAVTGLHDYVELLADDPATRVICLVIEKIRDAERFLAAVERAQAADTAVVALKLGRTERSREIMRSHTGAIADESWVYDLVLRHAGVITAHDVDDLLDLAQLVAQVPREQRRPVRGVAVMASSGGVAGVAADAAHDTGIHLPALEELADWVRERVPGDGMRNPLDLTGFVMRDPERLRELFDGYAHAEEVDALVLCWWAAEGDEAWSRTLLEPFAEIAARAGAVDRDPGGGDRAGRLDPRLSRAQRHVLPGTPLHLPRARRPRSRRACAVDRVRTVDHARSVPTSPARGDAGWVDREVRRRDATPGGCRDPGRPVRRARPHRRRLRRRCPRPPTRREARRRPPPD